MEARRPPGQGLPQWRRRPRGRGLPQWTWTPRAGVSWALCSGAVGVGGVLGPPAGVGLWLPRTSGRGRRMGVRQAQSAHPHRCTFDVAQASGQRTLELPSAVPCIDITQFSRRLQEMWARGGAISLRTERLARNQGTVLQPHMKAVLLTHASPTRPLFSTLGGSLLLLSLLFPNTSSRGSNTQRVCL